MRCLHVVHWFKKKKKYSMDQIHLQSWLMILNQSGGRIIIPP